MLVKTFDCTLLHWPTVRIHVNVPTSAAEVLEQVADGYLADLPKRMLPESPTDADRLALKHEARRLCDLQKFYKADEAAWLKNNSARLAADPASEPKDFAAAFPALFVESGFADRFAKWDVRTEYFRLYGLESSPLQWTVSQVDPLSPAPAAESDGHAGIRKQIGTHGTERTMPSLFAAHPKPESQASEVHSAQ
jgi:hypothetical protein